MKFKLVILTASLAIIACSAKKTEETTEQPSSAASYVGTWYTACYSGDSDFERVTSVLEASGAFTFAVVHYTDNACTTETADATDGFVGQGTYATEASATLTDGYNIDFTFTTASAPSLVGVTMYDVVKADSTTMTTGQAASSCTSSAACRPTAWGTDAQFIFTKVSQ